MPRQTTDISTSIGARYECDHCARVEHLPVVAWGSIDDQARALGYRIGPDGVPVWCPECSGRDTGYWDRRTLEMVREAGLDAGDLVANGSSAGDA